MIDTKMHNYLREKGVLVDDFLVTFISGMPVVAGGLIGGSIAESKRKYLSTDKKNIYVYKLKNFFRFGGMVEKSLVTIPFEKIHKIEMGGGISSGYMHFRSQRIITIEYDEGKIKGLLQPGLEPLFEEIISIYNNWRETK